METTPPRPPAHEAVEPEITVQVLGPVEVCGAGSFSRPKAKELVLARPV